MPEIPNPGTGGSEDAIRAESQRLLIRQSLPAAFYGPLVAGLLVYVLWEAQTQERLWTWFVLVITLSLLRLSLLFGLYRFKPGPASAKHWQHLSYLVTLVYAACWGFGGLWLMPADSLLHQLAILYFLLAMSGSAIAVLSANRPLLLATMAVLLLPCVGWFLSRGEALPVSLGLLAVVFCLSVTGSSRVLYHALQQNLLLNHLLNEAKTLAESQARIDELTQLYNRRAFYESGERLVAQSRRADSQLSAISLDVDWFKQINDQHGHEAGDRALRHLAELLTDTLRRADFCGRVGGEEFVVLLPDTGLEAASEVAQKLRETLELRPLRIKDCELTLTASFGVAEGHESLAQLLREADQALYEAKSLGRNRVVAAEGAGHKTLRAL